MMKTLKISHSAIEPHSSNLRTAYILSHRVLLFMGRGKIVWRQRIMCITQNRINFWQFYSQNLIYVTPYFLGMMDR
jgi:hypothetical protein